ncbi:MULTISPECIES: hypothetical protein [unclassified Pseudomonas]|nr:MULTISPECIES: hypothetical protein [unclassified Pseudomonas]
MNGILQSDSASVAALAVQILTGIKRDACNPEEPASQAVTGHWR